MIPDPHRWSPECPPHKHRPGRRRRQEREPRAPCRPRARPGGSQRLERRQCAWLRRRRDLRRWARQPPRTASRRAAPTRRCSLQAYPYL